MTRGTPWSRKMVNEQLQRVVAEVLAQLSDGHAAAAAAAATSGQQSLTPPAAI